jgi:hypothetical protein
LAEEGPELNCLEAQSFDGLALGFQGVGDEWLKALEHEIARDRGLVGVRSDEPEVTSLYVCKPSQGSLVCHKQISCQANHVIVLLSVVRVSLLINIIPLLLNLSVLHMPKPEEMMLLGADGPNPLEYKIHELFKVWDKKLILIADQLFPPYLLPMIEHVLSPFCITLELLFLLFHLCITASACLLTNHQELKDELDEV